MTEARDIGDGIHVVPVPVADLPVGDTQVYVMESPGGVVLVDVGWDDDRSWAALQAGLAVAGLSVTDVEGVVVTHFHPDHVGLTGRIREASGCWVAMNEADFAHRPIGPIAFAGTKSQTRGARPSGRPSARPARPAAPARRARAPMPRASRGG